MENDVFIILNSFFVVFFWRCAMVAFEDGQTATGWMQIVFSAGNGAMLAINLGY